MLNRIYLVNFEVLIFFKKSTKIVKIIVTALVTNNERLIQFFKLHNGDLQ